MIACTTCKSTIPENDFNVATDLALCRKCNAQYKYSDLVAMMDGAKIGRDAATKYIAITDTFHGEEIVYKKKSLALLFLIPFFCLWSGVSMVGIYILPLLKGELTMESALFGIPFLIGTVIMASVIIVMLFGVTKVILNKDKSCIFIGVGGLGWKRSFDAGNIQHVLLRDSNVSVNNVRKKGIVLIDRKGRETMFGTLIEDESKIFLAKYLAGKCVHAAA